MAARFKAPILLTTGSRNLGPYVREAQAAGCPLFVRVLRDPVSLQACREAGIPEDHMLQGRGPFSLEENRHAIREHAIEVLVTKDGGVAGGALDKIEAARIEGCHVVAIRRPSQEQGFESLPALVEELTQRLRGEMPCPNCTPCS